MSSDLSSGERDRLLQHFGRRYPAGEVIFREGDQGREVSGWVLLVLVLALVVANLYRAGLNVRARVSSARR